MNITSSTTATVTLDRVNTIERGQVWNLTEEFSRIMNAVREQDMGVAEAKYWGFTNGVIIVKSNSAINTGSLDPLVVVPLVTTKRYNDDIQIPKLLLSSITMDKVYPLVGRLFTVDESNLTTCICTLPNTIMSRIDERLKSLLFDEKLG